MNIKSRIFTFTLIAVLAFTTIIFASEPDTNDTEPGTNDSVIVAPTVGDFSVTGTKNNPITFTADDFTTVYEDTNTPILGLVKIKIVTLPEASAGKLKLLDADITADQEIVEADLSKISFVPETDYLGDATFTFQASNGTKYSTDPGTVTMTISEAAVTTTPIANNGEFRIDKNTILSNSLSATDPEDKPLTYIIETEPTHGTLTHTDESSAAFSYTPETDYVGEDSFTFKVNNGTEDSNIATVTITIAEPTVPVIPFNYVDLQKHWANFSASHLAALNLIVGEKINNAYYFYPERQVTRADFIIFLLAITEEETDSELQVPDVTFADANIIPEWMDKLAKKAYAKGIIKGSAEGNAIYLHPNNILTRSEAMVMVNNALNPANSDKELTYIDKDSIPKWALQSIQNLTAYQIIQGNADNTFGPNDFITRGQSAELCYKLYKQIEKEKAEAENPPSPEE